MSEVRIVVTPKSKVLDFYKDRDGCYSLQIPKETLTPITYEFCRDTETINNTIPYSRSYDVSAPYGIRSKKNKLLLGDITAPSKINSPFLNDGFLDAQIFDGSCLLLDGFLIINNVTKVGKEPIGVSFSIIDKRRAWVDTSKELCIKDIDLGAYLYDRPTVFAEMQDTNPIYPNRNIWYPTIFQGALFSGETSNSANFAFEDMKPVPMLMHIIREGFKTIGYTLKSDFFEKEFINKAGLDLIENFGYDKEITDGNAAYVGLSVDENISQFAPVHDPTFNNESGNFFDIGNNVSLISGRYQYVAPFDMTIVFDTCIRVNLPSGTSGFQNTTVSIELWVNNAVFQVVSEMVQTGETVDICLNIPNLAVLAGQNIFVRLLTPDNAEYIIRQDNTFVRYTPTQYIPSGATINLSDYINSRHKFWDLIRDLIKIFNLKQDIDLQNKIVCLEPAFDYTLPWDGQKCKGFIRDRSQAIDWTHKINDCAQVQCEFGRYKEFVSFCFAEDSNDDFLNATKTNENELSQRLFDLRYDYKQDYNIQRLDGSDKVQLEFLASTRNINMGVGFDIPSITSNEITTGNGFAGFWSVDEDAERTFEFTPRLLYFEGWNALLGITNWTYEGVQYNQYPKAYQASTKEPNKPNFAFDSVDSVVNGRTGMFDIFYKRYLANLNINGLNPFFLTLNRSDIVNLSPRDLICLCGFFYQLKKVENWLPNEAHTPVKVDFVQIKEIVNV